jgi:hypothetical protein
MNESHEKEQVNKLIETLKSQGVSEDSIALEWPLDNQHRVDLAIIDNVLNKPIALFEIKRRRDKRTESQAEFQIKQYASILKDQNIPLFIVFPSQEKAGSLDISRVKQELDETEDYELYSSDQIPNISVLTNSARQKTLFDLLKKKENAVENFQLVCWVMGVCSLVILLLNFANILPLSAERIALTGVVFGLFLLPFASKIKILGFEFERVKDAEK